MPRQPRQFEIKGVYHIVNRGVEKRDIFLKGQDYSRFILGLEFFNQDHGIDLWDFITREESRTIFERLEAERNKHHANIVELLAFVLMPNHYHLIVREVVKGGIIRFMRKMGGYVGYFNRQHNRVGPLFQSRYKAVPVFNDHLKTVFNYVHTNPVEIKEACWKKGDVKHLKEAHEWLCDYKWSSYRDYIGIPTFPTTTQRHFYLKLYGSQKKCRKVVENWVKNKAKYLENEGLDLEYDFM